MVNISSQQQEESPDQGEPPLRWGTNEKDWNDWRWQVRNSITSLEELGKYITLTEEEKQSGSLPLRITPYYSTLLNIPEIRKCIVPTSSELLIQDCEMVDPLAEERDRKTEHIIHRYPDRVLFLTTNLCASNCRYCTRSRIIENSSSTISKNWQPSFDYIKSHPEVRDVLLSGGDPLMLDDEILKYLLTKLYEIPTVEMVRIGSKIPIVLPQRITDNLLKVLSQFYPLYMSIHATFPSELTPEARQVCVALARQGHLLLGSQTVVLRGINDSGAILGDLFKKLLQIGIRPLYAYAVDLVPGSSHFRVPIPKILEIIEELRGWISGYAIPHFIVDGVGGKGKTPILPQYFLGEKDGQYLFRNYKGDKFTYPI